MTKNGFHKKQNLRRSVFSEQGSCLYKTGLIHFTCGRKKKLWHVIFFFFLEMFNPPQKWLIDRRKQNKVVGGYF